MLYTAKIDAVGVRAIHCELWPRLRFAKLLKYRACIVVLIYFMMFTITYGSLQLSKDALATSSGRVARRLS